MNGHAKASDSPAAAGTGALRRPRRRLSRRSFRAKAEAERQATERIDKADTLGEPFRPLERGRGHRSAMSLPWLAAAWNGFWFRRVPPHSLAAFRIIFGAYLLVYFLRFAGDIDVMFSNRGVYVPFLLPDLGLPPFWAWGLYFATLAVITLFTLGFRTRFITPTLLALYGYYYCLNLAVNDTAFDRLNLIFLVVLCFGELDATWSLCGGRHQRPEEGKSNARAKPGVALSAPVQPGYGVSVWAIRLITIQVAFLYFGSGYWKLINPYWHSGEMLRWTLAGPWGTPLAFWLVRLHPPAVFFGVLTWSVIALEMSMPILLFSRKLQAYGFAAGFLFHLSIALLLHIPEFMNCVCGYVLFVKPETVQHWGNALFQRLGGFFARLARG